MRRGWTAAGSAIAAILVLATYVFFATAGTWTFKPVAFNETHYANLAEGFRRGHLHMAIEPDAALVQMANPYDVNARTAGNIGFVWDASYYRGKYFLYFSPLPVLLFHLPYRLLTGSYPPDALAAVLFCAWSFIAAVLLIHRIRRNGVAPALPFPIWILLIGIGNMIPFTLPNVYVHILPVTLGMALTTTWAWALLRFWETRSAKSAAWMGFWLALAIVARPNLAVLLLLAVAVLVALPARVARVRVLLSAFAPLAAIGAAAAWYNYARFGSVFEFGVRYILNARSMLNQSLCSLCNGPELLRFINNAIHFIFFAPLFSSRFPFVELQLSRLDYAVSYPTSEPIGGVFAVIPVVMLGIFLAVLLLASRRPLSTEVRAAACWLAAGWLVLAGLSTCGGIAPRYSLDFMTLMTIGSIVCIEAGIALLRTFNMAGWPFRLGAALLTCYSIVLGFMLGFSSSKDTFTRLNPQLLERITAFFG